MNLTIKHIIHGSREYLQEVALRQRVLRDPLGLKYTSEQLEAEAGDIHIGIFTENEIAGCLILTNLNNGVAKMRQVAVKPEIQGKGIGSQLVRYFEGFAAGMNFDKITLHARETAVPFYLSLGYQKIGEQFFEVGIPHFEMEKII